MTKSDTTPKFFDALEAAGLEYHFLDEPTDDYFALLSLRRVRPFFFASEATSKQPPC